MKKLHVRPCRHMTSGGGHSGGVCTRALVVALRVLWKVDGIWRPGVVVVVVFVVWQDVLSCWGDHYHWGVLLPLVNLLLCGCFLTHEAHPNIREKRTKRKSDVDDMRLSKFMCPSYFCLS